MRDFSETEAAVLRRSLGLPQSFPVTLVKTKIAPPGDPLKIHIRTIFPDDVRREFSKWVKNWNKKDASKYGALEVALWESQAELILVQYKFPMDSETFNEGIRTSEILISNPDPIYTYIILRKPDSLEIMWRNFAWTNLLNPSALSLKMESALSGLLKERAKAKDK
ncbi:MAG TPA: hypothetical protein VGC91_05265 [Pyrinomonadaceae bacterium]